MKPIFKLALEEGFLFIILCAGIFGLALCCHPEVKPDDCITELNHAAKIQMDDHKKVALVYLDTDPFYVYYAGGSFTLDYREAKTVQVKDTCKLKEEFNKFINDGTAKKINNRLPVIVVDSPGIVIDKKDVFIHSGKGQQHNNTGTGKQIIINK